MHQIQNHPRLLHSAPDSPGGPPNPTPPKKPREIGADGPLFKCPICRTLLPSSTIPSFPFCSDRCRLLDLNNWLEGNYNLSRPIDPTDELDDLPKSRPERRIDPDPDAK